MTNRAQLLGRRILGALKNDSILLIPSTFALAVTIATASGKTFGLVRETSDGTFYVIDRDGRATHHSNFEGMIEAVSKLPGYRKPKARKTLIKALYHNPKMTGVSMGSFAPGVNL